MKKTKKTHLPSAPSSDESATFDASVARSNVDLGSESETTPPPSKGQELDVDPPAKSKSKGKSKAKSKDKPAPEARKRYAIQLPLWGDDELDGGQELSPISESLLEGFPTFFEDPYEDPIIPELEEPLLWDDEELSQISDLEEEAFIQQDPEQKQELSQEDNLQEEQPLQEIAELEQQLYLPKETDTDQGLESQLSADLAYQQTLQESSPPNQTPTLPDAAPLPIDETEATSEQKPNLEQEQGQEHPLPDFTSIPANEAKSELPQEPALREDQEIQPTAEPEQESYFSKEDIQEQGIESKVETEIESQQTVQDKSDTRQESTLPDLAPNPSDELETELPQVPASEESQEIQPIADLTQEVYLPKENIQDKGQESKQIVQQTSDLKQASPLPDLETIPTGNVESELSQESDFEQEQKMQQNAELEQEIYLPKESIQNQGIESQLEAELKYQESLQRELEIEPETAELEREPLQEFTVKRPEIIDFTSKSELSQTPDSGQEQIPLQEPDFKPEYLYEPKPKNVQESLLTPAQEQSLEAVQTADSSQPKEPAIDLESKLRAELKAELETKLRAEIRAELESKFNQEQELDSKYQRELGQELLRPTLFSQILERIQKKPLSRQELATMFSLKRISGHLNRTITKLLSHRLLERTIPENPTHPLQKFRLTDGGVTFLKELALKRRKRRKG